LFINIKIQKIIEKYVKKRFVECFVLVSISTT